MSRLGPIRNEDNSFVNNFWGPTDSGFKAIQTKMKDSVSTIQELLNYYQERMTIEKEYAKKLDKLNSKMTLGSHETGSLKKSLDKLSHENVQMSKHTNKFIKSISHINYDNLNDFYAIYSKKVSKIDHHMSKIIVRKNDASKALEASKSKFQEDCIAIKSLQLSCQTTWGKELEKNEAKLSKVSSTINQSKKAYQLALAQYKELNDIYIKDWSIALQDFYKLEIERIQLCKVNCFNFCNNIATLCVDNDQAVDEARSVFAKIQPPKDLHDFGMTYGTGDKIFREPRFIDFSNGYDDDEASSKNFTTADYETPDYQPILSRTYSTYSHASHASQASPQSKSAGGSPIKELPPLAPPNSAKQLPAVSLPHPGYSQSPPKTPSPSRKPPPTQNSAIPAQGSLHDYPLIKPKSGSVYSSSPEDKNDVFSIHNKNEDELSRSNGSSNYSNPTNYSSNYSSGERHWASPRRKEKQLNQFQEQINLKSKELPPLSSQIPKLAADQNETKNVPIMKDFSIDFIAKALEDLNSGGNGDISQYRRSVRRAKAQEESRNPSSKSAPSTPYKPSSDFVDDRDEVAVRYDSINFSSPTQGFNAPKSRPKSMLEPFETPQFKSSTRQRPRSMLDPYEPSYQEHNDSATTCIVKTDQRPRRTLSKSPTKSYTNLHSMIEQQVTPVSGRPFVSKAKARYTYKPQHHGELFFKKGWNIYILHKQEDNWFFCELGANCADQVGMVGLVPGNYLVEGNDVF